MMTSITTETFCNQRTIVKIILFFIFFTILYTPTDSCVCTPTHPQTHYCESEYVIIARILRKSTIKNGHKIAYKIEIKKSYKMSENAQNDLKLRRLYTSKHESACGINLNVGRLYVIAGRGSHITMCNYVKDYLGEMTIVQRRGFAGSYKKGCSCEIKPCYRGDCPIEYGKCNWSPFGKCQANLSACIPSRNITTPEGIITKCHWRQTTYYKKCLTDPYYFVFT